MKKRILEFRFDLLWLRVRRGVLYGLVLLAFLLAQNVIFNHIGIFGVHAMFMPAVVIAVALFEGGTRGGWFGVASGILCDMFFSSQTVMFTILFPIMGFAAGFLADFFLNRRFITYSIMAVLSLLVAAFAQMFSLLVYKGQSSFALWGTAILQTIISIPFMFPAYYICKLFPSRVGIDIPSPY